MWTPLIRPNETMSRLNPGYEADAHAKRRVENLSGVQISDAPDSRSIDIPEAHRSYRVALVSRSPAA